MATISDRVWQHLINQAIVRDPRVAGALPPAFRMPAEGTPAPAEGIGTEVGPTAVIGIFHLYGIPAPLFETQWREDVVEIRYRTLKWPDVETLYALVRTALCGPPVKMNWLMAGFQVHQSVEVNALGLVESTRAEGFSARSSVRFFSNAADHF